MAGRKLSRQQAWRIQKIQDEKAERARRKEQRDTGELDETTLGPEQTGRIIAHLGQQLEVEPLEGEQVVQRAHMRANLEGLVTGDEVIWCPGNPIGVVVARQPRRSELVRPDPYGKLRPVAANIDHLGIVIACEPTAYRNLIDRYLVAAHNSDISPFLVVNKADRTLASGFDMEALLEPYRQLNYPILETAVKGELGLRELTDWLRDKTTAFVGQSGVGKSSLINVLLPGVDLKVGELSAAHAKGRHTTTTARLFHFPGGGQLIDSPGIREFGLWHMDADQVANGFVEFAPYLGGCKFRDCRHQNDPGCALQEAADDGLINPERLASYHHLVQSLVQE